MRAPKKAATYRSMAAKLRSWRVSVIRKHGQYLGTVKAPNEKAAEATAPWRNSISATSSAGG
jgi:hypothetical protein